MKARVIRIGNSQGIRIPKSVISQCGFGDEVEMTVADGGLVITPVHAVRSGWDRAFAGMAEAGDDAPLLPDDVSVEWDESEWKW